MNFRTKPTLISMLALAATMSFNAHAATITTNVSDQNPSMGDTVTIEVIISDISIDDVNLSNPYLPEGANTVPFLAGYQTYLYFNESYLSYDSISFGSEVNPPSIENFIQRPTLGFKNGNRILNVYEVNGGIVGAPAATLAHTLANLTPQPDSFVLFTASFTVTADASNGADPLGISATLSGNGYSLPLQTVAAAAVPAPDVLLLTAGFLAVLASRHLVAQS